MRPCLNQCPRCIALPQSMSTLHRGSMLHHGDDGDDDGRCQRAWTRLRLQERRLLLRSAKLRCSSMPRATLLMVHVRACGALCQEPPCLWYIIVRVVLFAKSLLAYGHSLFMVIGDSLLWCFFAWSFSPHSLPGHSLLAPTPLCLSFLAPPLSLFLSPALPVAAYLSCSCVRALCWVSGRARTHTRMRWSVHLRVFVSRH